MALPRATHDWQLSRAAAEPVRRGHPWVFRDPRMVCVDGANVRLIHQGEVLGSGWGLADGPIAARVWTHSDRPVDEKLLRERTEHSVQIRARSFDADHTNAYRVIHGEGDRMPGVVVDRYGSVAVMVFDDAAVAAHDLELREAVWQGVQSLGVRTLLLRTRGRPPRVEHVKGEACAMRPVVHEHGVPFVVDLEHGQKTGAFLDQRENRRRVGTLAKDRRVLNLFSYAGGFSLHAAKGGATRVTSVDIAAQAHTAAQESFRHAGVASSVHECVTQDAFVFLEQAAQRAATWDLIISDPPSFAPNEKSVPKALAAYRKLHRACAAVLAPGGVFCASSCSSHVDARAFADTLDDATLQRSDLGLLELHGAPLDHPTLPAWPEGRYLKFAILG